MKEKIHIILCLIQGPKNKHNIDYVSMTKYCLFSLLKQGVSPADITCISEDKKHCKMFKEDFGINSIKGPPIPKKISHLVSKKHVRKLFMYKPISILECLPDPVDENTVMVMADVDSLFVKDPREVKCEADVYSQHVFRYLRPTRRVKMKKSHQCPKLDNMKELTGYFGSETQAYLFMKNNQKVLPEYRLTSNLVFIKPQFYASLMKSYNEMCFDIMLNKPNFCKGDQEVLSSAVDILGLRYSPVGYECSMQYNGRLKTKIVRDAKKMGIIDEI